MFTIERIQQLISLNQDNLKAFQAAGDLEYAAKAENAIKGLQGILKVLKDQEARQALKNQN